MKKAVVLLLMMALLVGCGKTNVPNTEGNTQQSEIPSEEENIEEDSQSSEETEEADEFLECKGSAKHRWGKNWWFVIGAGSAYYRAM